MTSAVLERVSPVQPDTYDEDLCDHDYDEYYEEDRALYESPKFMTAMEEAMTEAEDIIAHPEKYKFYNSVKEMLRDMGFDVSNFPDR